MPKFSMNIHAYARTLTGLDDAESSCMISSGYREININGGSAAIRRIIPGRSYPLDHKRLDAARAKYLDCLQCA
jgi:hypothetical protein